jgi:hypothetical protein
VDLVHGHLGQFEVQVRGHTVVSRKGGLIAKLTGRPWPVDEEVLAAVGNALEQPESRGPADAAGR